MNLKKLLIMDVAELQVALEYGDEAALHPERCY